MVDLVRQPSPSDPFGVLPGLPDPLGADRRPPPTYDAPPGWGGWGSTYAQQRTYDGMADTGVMPAAADTGPTAFAGSPLNTLYGIDSESYLTDDQRKLARMIQGKFDSSLNRRDRTLAQYGAPRLASFAEDEALARAMAIARGLNAGTGDPSDVARGAVGSAPRGSTGGGGGGGPGSAARGGSTAVPRVPNNGAAKTGAPAPSGANKWSQILGGLSSIVPLLFGKDAYGNLLNKGLINTIKDGLFGKDVSALISDDQLRELISQGGLPDAGGFVVNPITGMPIAPSPYEPPSIYGPGSGWGDDVIPGGNPSLDFGPGSEPGWGGDPGWDGGGGDWWAGGDPGVWDESGSWWPEAGGGWDWNFEDPFGISGW